MAAPTLYEHDLVARAIEALDRLPEVTVLRWTPQPRLRGTGWRPDALVELKVRRRKARYVLEFKRTLKGEGAWAERSRVWAEAARLPVILATTYCPAPTADRLAAAAVNFVDLAGNAHLRMPEYFIFLHGRQPAKPLARQGRGEGNPLAAPAALRIVYALLARPDREWKVNALAQAVGVAVGWTHAVVRALEDAGLIRRTKPRGPIAVVARAELMDRWLADYGIILRPQLVLGTFAPVDRGETAPEAVVGHLRAALAEPPTGRHLVLGGTWGADLLVHFYRGRHLVVHVDPPARDWLRLLRLAPDEHGLITLLAPVAPLMWEDALIADGLPVAPPLVLYAELLADADPRAHELAQELATAHKELRRGD